MLIVTILEFYFSKLAPRLKKNAKYGVSFFLLVLVGISIIHNRDVQHMRFTDPRLTYKKRSLYKIEPYVRQLGIKPEDTVIFIPDITPNAALTAIGNRGYTSFFDDIGITLSHFKNQGAKYLFVDDTSYLHNKLFTPYMSKPIGRFDDVYIFDLR